MTSKSRALALAALVVGGAFIAGKISRDRRAATRSSGASRSFLPDGRVVWQTVSDAPKLSAAAKKPILYDFNAEWCGPCHQLASAVFSDEEAAGFINEHFIPVSVVDRIDEDGKNAPEIDELQRRYEVSGFPTLVIADATGAPLGKIIGYPGKTRTIEFLKQTR